MEDLSLHILDIAENSIAGGATKIQIKIIEDTRENLLLIEIADNGKGMDENTIKMAYDPFFTTKTTRRVGLGIPLLAQAARESSGSISVVSKKDGGTIITANFQHNHIDRKPLGDIVKTITVLIAAHPDIDFLFEHGRNDRFYSLDTADIKNDIGNIPINAPEVIKFIKDDISQWLNDTKSSIL
ncbi:MAG: ATP-binding protein [Nitrospirae bacterium]|nr:ATP-binding protein [Nitrospirota bacterium]